MEVFLAKQHRIVLKDRAGHDLPATSMEFIKEPAPKSESPAEYTDTESDPIENSLPSMFEEEAGEDTLPDDSIEAEQADDQFEDEPAEKEEEHEEFSNKEDDVLVFGAWDDQDEDEEAPESTEEENAEFEETHEDSTQEENRENNEPTFMPWAKDKWWDSANDTDTSVEEAESLAEEDEFEESDLDEDESEDEIIEEPAEVLAEENDDLVAEFDSEEIPEQESESETPRTSNPPRDEFSKSLNPGGYSMQKFSVDHILPPLSSRNQESEPGEESEAPETQPEVQTLKPVVTEEPLHEESPAAQPAEAPRVFNDLHSSLHKSIRKLNQLEPEDVPVEDMGDVFEVETDESAELAADIPVLAPDVVARENIPTGMSGDSMAWLQSVPGPAHADKDSILSEDYTGADDKAQIMSNLSALEDEESLAPLEPEHLEAIDEEPVELHTLTDPLRHWKTAAGLLTCLILLAGLAGQCVMYNLDSLLIDRRYDSITNLVCRLTECPDKQVVDLTSLVTEELDVRSHPTADNALLVNFIFRNDASREQRFPLVELNFTDISGDVVANRVFTREEYLPSEMALFTHMPAHSSIQVSLELVDPGSQATGYSLVFRNP